METPNRATPPARGISSSGARQPARPTHGLEIVKAAREKATAGASSYYSAEARARLANEHTPIYLHRLRLDEANQFGPQWNLIVSEDTTEASPAILCLKSNDWRDAFFGQLVAQLRADPTPIGPLMLQRVFTRSGQETWDLTEWEPF